MMDKRILVVCRNFWPEDVRLNELCAQLCGCGFKIDVLCGQPSTEEGKFFPGYNSMKVRRESHDRLDIYRTVDVRRGEDSNIRLFLYYAAFPVFGEFLIRKLSQKKYDAVLIYQLSPVMMAGPGLRIAKKLAVPAYIYVASLWPETLYDVLEVRSPLFRKFLRKLSDHYYKKASALIVPTEKMKKTLMERLFLHSSDFHVVPSLPDGAFGQSVADDSLMEKTAGSFRLVLFEDKSEKMDVNSIITAAGLLRRSGVRNIRFVIVGDAGDAAELKKLVSREDLYEYFFFEGAAGPEQIGRYTWLADALLHVIIPKEAGEYQVSDMLLNYMAAGKAMIVTDQGSGKDLVKQAQCAITAAPADGENLFQCIMRLYQMPASERLRLGENAHRYLQEYRNTDETVQMLADILNGQAKSAAPEESSIKSLWDT